jgi:hypothetical protein
VASGLETILRVDGASNVEFQGVSFRHGAWASSGRGFLGFSGHNTTVPVPSTPGTFEFAPLAAAIVVQNGANITFRGCEVRDTAGTGMQLGDDKDGNKAPSEVLLVGNRFVNIAGAGIYSISTKGLVVNNNVFREIGLTYGANALSLVGGERINFSHNVVRQVGARGVYVVNGLFAATKESEFSHNLLDNLVLQVTDAGAFNVGVGGFKVTRNHVKNVRNSTFAIPDEGLTKAFYLDIGTTELTLTENLVTESDHFVQLNCQKTNTILGNHTGGLDGEQGVVNPCPIVSIAACDCAGDQCGGAEFDELKGPISIYNQNLCAAKDPICDEAKASLCASGTIGQNNTSSIAAQIKAQAGLEAPYTGLLSP